MQTNTKRTKQTLKMVPGGTGPGVIPHVPSLNSRVGTAL